MTTWSSPPLEGLTTWSSPFRGEEGTLRVRPRRRSGLWRDTPDEQFSCRPSRKYCDCSEYWGGMTPSSQTQVRLPRGRPDAALEGMTTWSSPFRGGPVA